MRKLLHHEISRLSPADLKAAQRHPVILLLHNIRSAYNVGSIFRTADAARLEGIVLSGYSPDPSHKGVRKSGLGAGNTVPWERIENPGDWIDSKRKSGNTIGVLEITDDPTRPADVTANHFPMVVVLGNEVDGVDKSLINRAHLAFEIPQFGAKQSLNVSVAAGVAVYDLVRTYRSL